MQQLFQDLLTLVSSLGLVIVDLALLLLPWSALAAWIAYWLLAADWRKLRVILLEQGGIVAVGFAAFLMVLIWGCVSPPTDDQHHLFGMLHVSNFVGKFVYVTMLLVIAALCGSVQLVGTVDPWLHFPEPSPADDHDHGHDDAHSHGHGGDEHQHGDHGHH
jgi:hypothetical protein